MDFITIIKTIIMLLESICIVFGFIPYIIILLCMSLIFPYVFYFIHTRKHIQKYSDYRTIKIAGYLSLIIPIIIVILSFVVNSSKTSIDYRLTQTFLIGPALALIQMICMYLCYNTLRLNRSIITDIKTLKNVIVAHKKIVLIGIILIALGIFIKTSTINRYTLMSNKLPINCWDGCSVDGDSMWFEKGNIISIHSGEDKESETFIYNYTYNKRKKEIKYYEENKFNHSEKLVYYDDKIFILKSKYKDHIDIDIGQYYPTKKNILDYYKKEANIDVSGYYQLNEFSELYLSPDKKIYLGNKEGIKQGTYEVLEFNPDYLSEPVINYTFDGEIKQGNTEGTDCYNDTSFYIKDTKNITISKSTYDLDIMKRIDDISKLKYLKNIK